MQIIVVVVVVVVECCCFLIEMIVAAAEQRHVLFKPPQSSQALLDFQNGDFVSTVCYVWPQVRKGCSKISQAVQSGRYVETVCCLFKNDHPLHT